MPTPFDLDAFAFVHDLAAGAVAPFEAAAAEWLIGLIPVCLIVLWLRNRAGDRTAAIAATIAAGLALALSGLTSFLVFEPRPFMIGLASNVLDHAADSSFPSDHVAVMSAVAVSLAFARRSVATAILATATLLVGWSRVAVGIHFPIDIVAGASFGAFTSMVLRAGLLSPFVQFVVRVGETVSNMMGVDKLSELVRKS